MLDIFNPNRSKKLQLAQSGRTPRSNILPYLLIENYSKRENIILDDFPQLHHRQNQFDKLLKKKRSLYYKSKRAWRRKRKVINAQINLVKQKIRNQ